MLHEMAAGELLIDMFKKMINSSPNVELLKKQMINPFTITVAIFVFLIIHPCLFLKTVYDFVKENIFRQKSILVVEAEKEAKEIKEARKKSEDFMQNEGTFEPRPAPNTK